MKNLVLLIPLLAIIAIGYILTMIIQPSLFSNGLITPDIVNVEDWIRY